MEKVLKFPKERTKLINSVQDAYDDNNYRCVVSFKDQILDNFVVLKDEKVFDNLIESFFELYAYDEVIMVGEELIKHGYESFELYFYMLSSLIAQVDIYQAKSLIKRSKLLNQDDIKYYYTNEGANYSNILSLSYCLFEQAAPCLLLVNYISEVSKEMAGDIDVDHEYLLFRFFDLINMIYELGYDYDIILKFDNTLKIIFEIDI